MPLYTVTTQTGVLDEKGRSQFAAKLTHLHCELSGVPKNWVHIVFQDYAVGSGFTAGAPAATVSLTVLIRAGRSVEYKRDFLRRLWDLVQTATAAPDDQIVVVMQELPASNAMELGKIMPDVTQ